MNLPLNWGERYIENPSICDQPTCKMVLHWISSTNKLLSIQLPFTELRIYEIFLFLNAGYSRESVPPIKVYFMYIRVKETSRQIQ
jgi:hypothetical protein